MSGIGIRRCFRQLAAASSRGHDLLLHRQTCLGGAGSSALQVRHVKKQVEVILTERVENLGEAGDIVKVAAGYARNFLCPQLKAMPAISKYVNLVKQNLQFFPPKYTVEDEAAIQKAKEEKDKQKEIDKVLRRFDTTGVTLYRIIKDPTNLKDAVTVKDLVPEVARQLQIEIQEGHLDLREPIATLGHFEVPLRLPPDLPLPGGKTRLHLKVRIRRKNYLHHRKQPTDTRAPVGAASPSAPAATPSPSPAKS